MAETGPVQQAEIHATPPVFHAKKLTLTKEHGAKKDAQPPAFGRLSAGGIASTGGLADALPGNDTKVVHGNYIAHLMNNRDITVMQDDTVHVQQNQSHTIQGETDLTYVHGRDTVVGDEDKLAVNGIQEKFVLGESEETYIGKHEVHVPQEFEIKMFESGLTVLELKFLGGSVSIRGREAVYTIQDLECSVFKTEEHILREKVEAHEGTAAALTDKAAVTADVNARVDVAPSVGLGTPVR